MQSVKNYVNVSFFGNTDSGKCTLAKAITIACNCISTPSNFSYKNSNFFIMPIPCSHNEYVEKYDLSSNLGDIAIIVIDVQEIINKDNMNLPLVLDLIKNVQNIVFCLNKIDKVEFNLPIYEKLILDMKNYIDENLNNYLEFFPHNKINVYYVPVSAKENINLSSENILTSDILNWYKEKSLLEILDNIASDLLYKNTSEPLFFIYDFYRDEEENFLVVSGKNITGELTINQEYCVYPANKKIKIAKISNCEGVYINQISQRQFATLKIKLDDTLLEDLEDSISITRGDIIKNPSNENTIMPQFNTFEADVIFLGDNLPMLISPGLNCKLICNLTEKECEVDSIIGEYDSNTLIKKKFIRPQNKTTARIVLTNKSSTPIFRNKYEVDPLLGSFSLKLDASNTSRTMVFGKILRYKKI